MELKMITKENEYLAVDLGDGKEKRINVNDFKCPICGERMNFVALENDISPYYVCFDCEKCKTTVGINVELNYEDNEDDE